MVLSLRLSELCGSVVVNNASLRVMSWLKTRSKFATRVSLIMFLVSLVACSQSPDETPTKTTPVVNSSTDSLGEQSVASLKVLDVAYVDSGVLAPLSVTAGVPLSSVSWQQVAGPTTTIIDGQTANAWVLMPFTQSNEQINLAFQVSALSASGEQLTAIQQVVLMPISPQVAVNDRWLNTQNSAVNVRANFQHAVFNDGSVSSEGPGAGGGGQLPPDPNNPPSSQQVTLPIIWRDDPTSISQILTSPPQTITFNFDRLAELAIPLSFEPLSVGSDLPFEVITLQFDIVLPTGERSPVSVFVRRPVQGNGGNSSLSASLSFSTSSVSSNTVLSSSNAQTDSSLQSSINSSSIVVQISSSVATSSINSSGASSSNSVDSSSSSALMSSSSSGPSERELAVAAICADNWQGLGSLPRTHANYQTESPYLNADPFIDPVFVQHIEQSQALVAENAALVAAMEMLKTQPTGVWLDTGAGLCESVNGKPSLVEYLNLAEARNQLLTLVLYNIPARDCVRQERLGEFDATEQGLIDYQLFIDRFSALTNLYLDLPIAAVVEPTAFASTVSNGGVARTGCFDARQIQLHERALDYALKRLASNANIFTYLDYGDPSWPGSYNGEQALLELLANSQLTDGSPAVEGISLNVGSYVPLEEPFMLAQDNSGEPYVLPKGIHSVNAHIEYLRGYLTENAGVQLPVLVDTARNGWGGELRPQSAAVGKTGRIDRRPYRFSWCNSLRAGLGEPLGSFGGGQYFYVTPVGLSNGNQADECTEKHNIEWHVPKLGAPTAGEWFHEYFVDLINNAYPPLLNPVNNPDELPLLLRATPLRIPVQDVTHVNLNIALPEGVVFQSLAIKYASEEFALPEGWQGQNNVDITLGSLSLTYFHDLLKITATGSDGQHYFGEAAVFDSPNFDGKPVMDIALGGRGFFPDFYGIYQADIPEYTYTNNGFEGDDFLWLSSNAPSANGGAGDDYLQVRSAFGGPGNDVLAAWGYASGGEGDDVFYAWDANVTVEDTPNDFDIVHWLGRNFNSVDLGVEIELRISDEDLIMIESPNRGDKQATLLVKGFFANPPHINEIHYGDGQILTPETAREMLGLNAQ